MSHPVYPDGPPCNPHCPGEWSSYHEGYADGFEVGEKVRRGFAVLANLPADEVDDFAGRLVAAHSQTVAAAVDLETRVVSQPPEHITDAGDCWCQPTALKTVEGDYIFVHKEVVQ
jgi:hypothetical protein